MASLSLYNCQESNYQSNSLLIISFLVYYLFEEQHNRKQVFCLHIFILIFGGVLYMVTTRGEKEFLIPISNPVDEGFP